MSKDLPTRLAEALLGTPVFRQAVSTAVKAAMEVKSQVDRNVESLLGLLNLPSRGDLMRLQAKLDALQGAVTNLSIKVDRLLDSDGPEAAPPRREHATTRAPR